MVEMGRGSHPTPAGPAAPWWSLESFCGFPTGQVTLSGHTPWNLGGDS